MAIGSVILNMTGDEFKELIEGRTKDGVIKTIPEVIDALNGTEESVGIVKERTQKTYVEDEESLLMDFDENEER